MGLADDGVPVNKVQKVIGHSNVTTTLQLDVRKTEDPDAMLDVLTDEPDEDGGSGTQPGALTFCRLPRKKCTNRRSCRK
jgi:hypothetical protein